MFTKKATINELSQIVKNGKLTEAQEKYLETMETEEKNDENNNEDEFSVNKKIRAIVLISSMTDRHMRTAIFT